jgi:hypothetical protein
MALPPMTLGEVLAWLRRRCGIRLMDSEKFFPFGYNTVYRMEHGRRDIDMGSLELFAQTYGVDVEDLMVLPREPRRYV